MLRSQAPPRGRFSSPRKGPGICVLNKFQVTPVQSSRAPLAETLLCRDGDLVLEGGLSGEGSPGSLHWGALNILFFIIPSLTKF